MRKIINQPPAIIDPQGIIPAETMAAFKDGFDDEVYLIRAIKTYLMTDAQWEWLSACRIDIADVLNGRIEGGTPPEVEAMFDAWNARLGFRCFGF